MSRLDLTILPGIESAIRSAARLTAAGHHESAKDDLRRAFLLAGEQLGLTQLGLSMLLDAALATRDDYESAKASGRVVEVERHELLRRLNDDTERLLSPERDTRAHDSYAAEIT